MLCPLKPSLVEWKHTTIITTINSTNYLETFLSGMETVFAEVFILLHAHALKPSLVEWKQQACAVYTYGGIHLETFLSGMETGQAPSPRQGLNSLETFLSGMETGP